MYLSTLQIEMMNCNELAEKLQRLVIQTVILMICMVHIYMFMYSTSLRYVLYYLLLLNSHLSLLCVYIQSDFTHMQ